MFHRVLKIFFPDLCSGCGVLGDSLCKRCFHGLPFSPHVRDLDGLKVFSAFYYEEEAALAKLIHRFKYKHEKQLARFFATFLMKTVQVLAQDEPLWLVPVPLHPSKERERGFNQCVEMAKFLERVMLLKPLKGLRRSRATSSQAQLKHRKERAENIQGAFTFSFEKSAAHGRPFDPSKDGQVILLDDIVTTGSTLLEVKATLEAAGIPCHYALTLADRA